MINVTRPGVALVIPVLNEGEAIGQVVRAIPGDIVDEVIIVDGGSRDDTVARAEEAGARVVIEPRSGYGAACLAGARSAAAACQVIAFMDGDGSDDPADLKAIVAPIISGAQDFVIGSRLRGTRQPGSLGLHQALAGHLAGLAIRLLYGVRYTDMGPLRAIRRDALEALGMQERTYGWNLEMQMRAARSGLRILELPVQHRNRAGGVSKVAGSVMGTVRAGCRIAVTIARVALQPR
ncbi:MAG: glycosyltransferase family 2 protein [Xanthobacteraceae bacterium]